MLTVKFSENTQLVLLYSLPIFLITGSFLADLCISLIGLFFLYITYKKKIYYYYQNVFVKIAFLWCIYLIIISLFSTDPLLSLESSLFYFRFILFTISVWYILDKNKNFSKNFLIILLIIFIVILCEAYLEFLFNYNYSNGRISGLFGDNLVIGSYLSRLIPLLLALCYLHFQNSNKMILFSMFLLMMTEIFIYISGERTSFAFVILIAICMIFLTRKFIILRLITFILSLLFIILITINSSDVKKRMIDVTLDQTSILSDKKNIISERHESFYRTSINIFYVNPIVGVGPKLYRNYCGNKKYEYGNACSTHPHNTYMQLLAETGLIGTLPVFILFIYILFILSKQFIYIYFKKQYLLNDYSICLYIAILVTVWPFAPSMQFFNNWISIIYYLPIGFLLNEQYKNE
jgi:O-antigen ligase|tara:strand:+ start:3321 stop:4538 length:1218 start_codon:yes stop_codon:yes gene_type:complete